MLNKQGPGKIDWTDWTWNPISGCLHGCPYCYMLRMEKRFPGMMEPKFHPDRLEEFKRARKVKPGDKVFVGSSGDMWGEWVKSRWIMETLETVSMFPRITFQFLTKNPGRYHGWAFFENCWFGTTVDGTTRTQYNLFTLLRRVPAHFVRFVSFEPLIERPLLNLTHFKHLDWIIIGADSTRGAEKPPKEWADYLINTARNFNIPVWVKDNYGYPEIIKEFPEETI
jgi:protein gp37